jgi:hypothetical protein
MSNNREFRALQAELRRRDSEVENLEKKVAAAEVAMLKCEQENQAKLAQLEESRVKYTQEFEERRLGGA